jgi:predicted dehydrogenase
MSRRVALIGLSWITADPAGAPSHPVLGTAIPYSHASALAAIPDVEVVAACDIVGSAREGFHRRWAGRWPGLRTYADHREMLATERPDVALVATPDHLHTGPVLAAIEAGVRGVVCEKPLSTSLEDADRIIEAATAAGTVIQVNYTRRWMPEWVEARRILESGEIGRLSQIVAQIGGPRAMLYRNHTHVIDLIGYLAGSAPSWVIAELEPGYEDYGTTYRGDGGNDPGTEPGANYYVAYENGVRAYVTGMKDTIAAELAMLLVAGDGRIVVDLEGIRIHTMQNTDIRTTPGIPFVRPVTPNYTVAGFQAAWLDLFTALDTGGTVQSPPEAARQTVALTEAILMSQQRGNVPVRLHELGARTAIPTHPA